MPFNPKLHLFAILNDPCPINHCLLVMITTVKQGRPHDDACILDNGDHPFIGHASYALYRIAQTAHADHITKMLAKNYYVAKEDFAPQVFKRLADGLFASDETLPRIVKYAESVGV